MAKTNGKLKYDLALSTTTVYDASSVYVNKSAELSINGNANLEYKTIGASYSENLLLVNQTQNNQLVGPSVSDGKAYLYVRNLGPASASTIRIAIDPTEDNTDVDANGVPDNYDPSQIVDLAVNEFMFMPVVAGSSIKSGYFVRSSISDVTIYPGPTYNEIEYMLCYTTPNIVGPSY